MKRLFNNKSGAAALESAIILPLLLAIIFAVIEFGAYFVKDQLALNAIGSVAAELRMSPSSDQARTNARNYGGAFMAFDENPNFFCAQSYPDTDEGREQAIENTLCTEGWSTERPAGVDVDDTYIIAIVAATEKLQIVFSNFLPDIRRTEMVVVGGSTLPDCDNGEIIIKTAAGLECRTLELQTKYYTETQKATGSRSSSWGKDCPAGYKVSGCSWVCDGTEIEVDLSFQPTNGCRVDANTKCGTSTGSDLTVYTNCMRIVYN